MGKSYVIISDTQLPDVDTKSLKAVIKFIGDYQPDEVTHIGDVLDYPEPSRWNKDTKGEFEGSVFADSEDAKRRLLEPLRAVYEGPIGFLEGNHDERPRKYLGKYAPALADSTAFDFENLLDFKRYEISKLPDLYHFAPGWAMTHGHKHGISLNSVAGRTAGNAAEKLRCSLVMGHTHRAGISSITLGTETKPVTYHGVEIGHLMDTKKATYVEGVPNWQKAFGLAYVDGNHVSVHPVYIKSKKFVVEGVTYQV